MELIEDIVYAWNRNPVCDLLVYLGGLFLEIIIDENNGTRLFLLVQNCNAI